MIIPVTESFPHKPVQTKFDPNRACFTARAPGRLDLMGGNVDYTGGAVLQSLVREGISVTVQTRVDRCIQVSNSSAAFYGWEPVAFFDLDDLDDVFRIREICNPKQGLEWVAYIAGSLHLMRKRRIGLLQNGIQISIASDLPANKGVSSSAALVIATLKAVSAACGESLTGVELAEAGQWVENEIVQSACGIMDHAAIVFGQENTLLPLLCQPLLVGKGIQLPSGVRLWGVDSMASRATNSLAYTRARAAAFMAYKILCDWECLDVTLDTTGVIPRWCDKRWNGYLSNLALESFRSRYEVALPETLSGRDFLEVHTSHVDPFTSVDPDLIYPVQSAARYAVLEHDRVQRFTGLLSESSQVSKVLEDHLLREAGELMYESHHAYRETGLASARCDEIVDWVRSAGPGSGLFGAKMTGGGGGGTVAVLGLDHAEAALRRIVEEYGRAHGVDPYVFTGSSDGTDTIEHHSASQTSRRTE
jgi:galactokinase